MTRTDITRPQYEHNYGRYASDCSDEEWALIVCVRPLPPNTIAFPTLVSPC